jgi:hypothetical protein
VYQVPLPAFRRTSGFRVNGLKLPLRPHSYVPRQRPSVDSDGLAGGASDALAAGGMPSLAFLCSSAFDDAAAASCRRACCWTLVTNPVGG